MSARRPRSFRPSLRKQVTSFTNAELEVMNHAKQSGCTKEEFIKDIDMDFS